MLLSKPFWAAQARMFFDVDDSGGGAGDLPTDEEIDKMDELGDAGKKALRDQRDRRKAERAKREAAEEELKKVNAQVQDLTDRLDKKEKAEQAARDKAAKEGGDFQKLAEKYEGERDQLKADLDTLQKNYDALNDAAKQIVKLDFDTIPDTIKALYLGDAENVVEMLKFVPKAKEAAKTVAGEPDTKSVKGAEPDPPDKTKQQVPPEAQRAEEEAARAAWSRQYM